MSSRFLNISTDNTLGGGSASDEVVSSQKAIKEYVDSHSSNVTTDGVTINTNADDEIQAIGVIDDNTSNPIKTWTGTKAQYDAIVTKDSNTLYNITDDEVSFNGDYVIKTQLPTSENNYTWYRLYKSGWVEQGGIITVSGSSGGSSISFAKEMANTSYTVLLTAQAGGELCWCAEDTTKSVRTTTSCGYSYNFYENRGSVSLINWEVKGMAL